MHRRAVVCGLLEGAVASVDADAVLPVVGRVGLRSSRAKRADFVVPSEPMSNIPRISSSVWESMSAEERDAHVQQVRDARAGTVRSNGRGSRSGRDAGQVSATGENKGGSGTGRLPQKVWASMTQEERTAHIKYQRRERRKRSERRMSSKAPDASDKSGDNAPPNTRDDKKKGKNRRRRQRRHKKSEGRADESDPTKAWRFAQYDRVRCNLGESGWCSGNVQALNEPDPSGRSRSLPYVVMLDPPIKRLISVPQDTSVCVRPDICFAAFPEGGECAEQVAIDAATARGRLRFAVGDRVVCLTAGPDGNDWPRRWSSGTVTALWPQPPTAEKGAVVPYTVTLDAANGVGGAVLAHRDDHMYVRALELQHPGECPSAQVLSRFTERQNEKLGQKERVDQQTLVVRKVAPAPEWTDSDSEDEDCPDRER